MKTLKNNTKNAKHYYRSIDGDSGKITYTVATLSELEKYAADITLEAGEQMQVPTFRETFAMCAQRTGSFNARSQVRQYA